MNPRSFCRPVTLGATALLWLLPAVLLRAASGAAESTAFFENRIRPVLASECYECHGAAKQKGGLRLDSRDGVRRGGESGPAVIPGDGRGSRLVQAITQSDPEHRMPRNRPPLEASVVADIVRWVDAGAPDPRDQPPAADASAKASWESVFQSRRKWWSLQPVGQPAVPMPADTLWAHGAVDRFILAKLEERGIVPAPDAGALVWLRRVHFAITGLPPSPEEVADFSRDRAPDARARVVDRLLNSPRYGERWARHWMDLVRFAETYGHEQDFPIAHAWRYRDYLIRAFNADVPYDQFVREHLAGDLLRNPRRHPTVGFDESVIGTGFWYLHQATHAPVDPVQDEADRIDNQIDVFSKTFLGLTVACARCHDHKFDAVSTRDYYGLVAFLRASRQDVAYVDPDGSLAARVTGLQRLHAEQTGRVRAALRKARASGAPAVASYLLAAEEVLHGPAKPGDAAIPAPSEPASKAPADAKRRMRPVAAVASERGIDPVRLEKWVAECLAPDAVKPTHPLQPWLGVAPRAGQEQGKGTVVPPTVVSKPPVPPAVYLPFASSDFRGWFPSGQAFAPGTNPDGNWRVAGNGIDLFPAGVAHSGVLAAGLQGTLRSPTFELGHNCIHFRLAGTGGQVRLIIARYGLLEYNSLLFESAHFKVNTDGRFDWFSINTGLARHKGRPAYLEIVDGGGGHVAVDQIVFSDNPGPPPGPGGIAVAAGPPAERARAVEAGVQRALDDWLDGTGPAEGLPLLSWLSQRGLLDWGAAAPELDAVVAERTKATVGLAEPIRILAMTDGSVEPTRVFVRGDHRNPGPPVSRRFLEAVSGREPVAIAAGSGRRELANALVSDANPLLDRVLVNRVWAHVFGRGLVPTVDNFGAMGQGPTHPELLDWLAADFRRRGRSIKGLIRSLCLTRTYGMSSSPGDAGVEARDPDNALLHRMRLVRLEGETVRDALLAASGRLNPEQFGPSVPTHFTPFMGDRMWVKNADGPLDGNGRRSVYLETRRNFLSPWMLAFDLPVPDTTVGQRNSSNVPAQALALMNDPLVRQQADVWAANLVRRFPGDSRRRVESLFLGALGRPPLPVEADRILAFLAAQAGERGIGPDAIDGDPSLWADACHVLFMSKEFIHVP